MIVCYSKLVVSIGSTKVCSYKALVKLFCVDCLIVLLAFLEEGSKEYFQKENSATMSSELTRSVSRIRVTRLPL